MMSLCSLLAVVVPWSATCGASEVAEIEDRVLAGRTAITQAHMVFESSITYLKDSEERPLDIVRTFYLDGEKVRCDERRRYDQQQWFIRQPYDPGAAYFTEKRCFSEDEFFLYSDCVSADGKQLIVRVTERGRALKIDGYRVPDLRNLGLTPDSFANSGFDLMERFIRAPHRENLSVSPAVEQGEECQRIQFTLRGTFVQVWVAPSKGYSILRHRGEFDFEDTHYVDDIQLNVKEHNESGIWFPVSSHYRRTENGRRTREERLKVTIVSLNGPLDPKLFTLAGLDIPVGERVSKQGASPLDYHLVWDGDRVISTRASATQQSGETPSRSPYDVLNDQWKAERDSLKRTLGGEEAAQKLNGGLLELRKVYTHRFLKLATEHPSDGLWLDCLIWISVEGVPGPSLDGMIDFMRAHANDVENTTQLMLFMSELIPLESDRIGPALAEIAEQHSNRLVRGAALYALAARAKMLAERDGSPEGCKAAQDLLHQVIAEFPDVRTYRGKNKENAERLLHELQSPVAIGETAIETKGKTLDGSPFDLAGQKGKVTVLAFSGHWCGPCVKMHAIYKELLQKYAEDQLMIVEVNSDGLDQLASVEQKVRTDGLHWRIVIDGPHGPLSKKWNVTSWPTFYVLDCKHRIRRRASGYIGRELVNWIEQLINESISRMPPRRLAQVARQNEKGAAITWAEAQEGLAVGVGAVRTSLKSPIWVIVDGYLENQGTASVKGIIRSQARFLLELDGRFYAQSDFGGLSSRMEPGTRYGPIAVETKRFHEVKRLAPFPVVDDNAPAPILAEGEHTLRLHYKLDRKLISSAPIAVKVSLSPYPEQEAVATIARELTHADSWVRGTAALAAKDLRLSGCRDALVRALKDRDGVVRRYSAEALGEFGDRAAIEPLKALLNDSDMGIRLAAADSLVKLGEALDVAWVQPIIKSKHSVFENAIWLVRRHGGERAVPTLIRCLDTKDPSVKNYYNYTLVWQIAACGGPRLRYHHDFDGKGAREQVEENREVLAQLQDWLHKHSSEQ